MADLDDDEESRAEIAKEFRTNLNRSKGSRKRYSIASPYAHAKGKPDVVS